MRCHPPNLCSVRFVTFMDSSKANYVLETIYKRFGIAKDPPPLPLDGTTFHFLRRMRRTAPLCLGTRTFIVDDFQQVCLRVGTMTDQRSTTPRRARLSLIAHKTLPKTEWTRGLGAFDIWEQIHMKTNFRGTCLKIVTSCQTLYKLFLTGRQTVGKRYRITIS